MRWPRSELPIRFVALILLVVATVVSVHFVRSHYWFTSSWSSSAVSEITREGITFYIVPEGMVNKGTTILNKTGNRFYILSEDKLRLIGPEFWAKISGDE